MSKQKQLSVVFVKRSPNSASEQSRVYEGDRARHANGQAASPKLEVHICMTIKQNKFQTILYAIITFVAAGLFCFAIFDMRKLPHDYSFVLDKYGCVLVI